VYTFNTQDPGVPGFRAALAKVEFLTMSGNWVGSNELFNIGYYNNIKNAPKTVVSTEEIFSQDHNGVSLVNTRTTESNYSPNFPMLLTDHKTTNSDGSVLTEEFYYVANKGPVSYSNQTEVDAANQLYADGRFGVLLQQTKKVNGSITDVTKNGYKKWTINNKQLVLPETVYNGRGTAIKPKFTVYQYDEYGNTLSAGKIGAARTSTLWGHNNLLPVAEAQNAAPEEIFFEDFEQSGSSNVIAGNAYSGKKYFNGDYPVSFTAPNTKAYKVSYHYYSNGTWHYSGLLPFVNSMVLSLGDAIDQVTIIPEDAKLNSYAYDPHFFGVTSVTDTRGETSSYEYDSYLRLKLVRDNQGRILKRYDYNSKH
jgi:YD repeat-containing protein